MLKVNLNKLKERVEAQKNEQTGGFDKVSIFIKGEEEGTTKFRAMIYPHNDDPTSEPFCERNYHFIYGLGYVYCPKANENQDCHVCEFIWERFKGCEDDKEKKEWLKCLPVLHVMIPGVVRGKEEDGVKFLKITSRKDRPSEKHTKIYDWFMDKDLEDWISPEKGERGGFDIEIKYGAPDPKQAAHLKLKKGSVIMKEISLARKSTAFKEYEDFADKIPNIDEIDGFKRLTTQDTVEVLEKWSKKLQAKSDKMTKEVTASESETDEDLNKDMGSMVTADSVTDDLAGQLKDLGL